MTKRLLLSLNFVLFFFSLLAPSHGQTSIGFNTYSGLANCPNCLGEPMSFITIPSAEFVLQRQVVRGLYAEVGLNFQERGYGDEVVIRNPLTGETVDTWKYKEQLFFAGVPLSLVYKFRGFYARAGMSINYFAHRRFINRGVLVSNDRSILEPVHLGSQFAAGYAFTLKEQLKLNAGLIYTTVYLTETPSRLSTMGINLGLSFTLPKKKIE